MLNKRVSLGSPHTGIYWMLFHTALKRYYNLRSRLIGYLKIKRWMPWMFESSLNRVLLTQRRN